MTKRDPARAVRAARQTKIEDCLVRLNSVETLSGVAPRDASLLAEALVEDVLHLVGSGDATATGLANVVRGAVAVDPFSAEALRSLRALVSLAVARVEQERDTGLKAVRQALSRWSPVQILAVVCLLIAVVIVVGLQLQGANTRRGRDFTGLFARASSRQGAGDHAGAAELFNAAIAVLPDTERTADAWNDLGWSLLMLNKDDDAIAAFRKALMLKPAFPRARNNLEVAQRKIDLKKAGAASQPTPR